LTGEKLLEKNAGGGGYITVSTVSGVPIELDLTQYGLWKPLQKIPHKKKKKKHCRSLRQKTEDTERRQLLSTAW
jgi:hypothetical protein